MKYLKCNKCGWVHFALNKIGGMFSFATKCFKCGNSYKDFSPCDSAPIGSTIQPILYEEDKDFSVKVSPTELEPT